MILNCEKGSEVINNLECVAYMLEFILLESETEKFVLDIISKPSEFK